MTEIIITVVLAAAAVTILFRSIRKKSKAQCDCGSCSAHCPSYKK